MSTVKHVSRRQKAEKSPDVRLTEFRRVAQTVEANEKPRPVHVRLFGFVTVVAHANRFAQLVKQTGTNRQRDISIHERPPEHRGLTCCYIQDLVHIRKCGYGRLAASNKRARKTSITTRYASIIPHAAPIDCRSVRILKCYALKTCWPDWRMRLE